MDKQKSNIICESQLITQLLSRGPGFESRLFAAKKSSNQSNLNDLNRALLLCNNG